jgi:type IV pilus assembly protein PilF
VKKLLILVFLVVIAGCVSQGQNTGKTDATKTEMARNRARIHAELGTEYYARGQLGVALEELKVAVAADPSYVPAHNQLGLIYMALGEDKPAEQAFERALKIDPEDSPTNNNYGLFLCQRKRGKDAMKYFAAALKNPLYSTPENAYTNAGVCARLQGDDAKAEDMLRKALALQPNQPLALYQLADLRFSQGDVLGARSLLARHMQVSRPSAEGLWLGARIENRLGDRNALASYGVQLNNRFASAPQTKAFNEGRFQ